MLFNFTNQKKGDLPSGPISDLFETEDPCVAYSHALFPTNVAIFSRDSLILSLEKFIAEEAKEAMGRFLEGECSREEILSYGGWKNDTRENLIAFWQKHCMDDFFVYNRSISFVFYAGMKDGLSLHLMGFNRKSICL
jgi:hypothetical protein